MSGGVLQAITLTPALSRQRARGQCGSLSTGPGGEGWGEGVAA